MTFKFERAGSPARKGRSLSVFRSLRHIGFKSISIRPDCERVSDGPSVFHELDFCVSGNVSVQIWRNRKRAETLIAGKGDFIFIPAGTTYSLYCTNDEPTTLVSATAREGVDVNALPLDTGAAPPLPAADYHAGGPQPVPFEQVNEAHHLEDVGDEDGHVVLFFDRRPYDTARDGTIGRVFHKQVIAREFGVSETELPELSLSFSEPLVIRSISIAE
ncbi:hypothetical protein [Rhizobium sp. Root1220]|uniref:hypothetical protein n=1 Tax=Rhizobium sp. Root1220 TaxID=1736432 RepID=UPI0006F7593E|nr:hypothetical protein [Rhizobium sp. Root1220]KQV83557.1 hypothetical protein ASC90_19860 [Rhizobium sp. Root1220]